MGVFGVVELQGAADAVDDGFGDTGGVAPFEAFVVLRAHSRHQRDFLAAQPRHPAATAEVWQPHLRRREFRAPRGEELADRLGGVHAIEITPTPGAERGPVGAPIGRATLTPAKER